MIIPSGSAALSIDTEGKAVLCITAEDELIMFIESPLDTQPIEIKFGKGQQAFDELVSNVKRLAIFSGD